MMRRTLFSMAGGAMAAGPVMPRAQRLSRPVVGFLADGTPEGFAPRFAGVKRGLADAGLTEGRDVALEPRWARGNYELLPALAGELVGAKTAVIVTAGTERVVRAAMAATSSIPIVATMAGDPVKRGIVASISRPGGNVTVVSLFTSSSNALVAKRVELLREVVPKARTLGWLVDGNILDYDDELHDLEDAARAISLGVSVSRVVQESEIENAFQSLTQTRAGAMLETGPLFFNHRARLAALAAQASMPMLYEWREFVQDGGLMSYGTNLGGVFRQAGNYASRIIRGERVGDLPVVQEPKVELVVNLRTARALGLSIPAMLLARADEVIE